MSNIAKLVIGSNKIFPEKRHTNATKLLSYTKNWLNLSNISNRKKIGIQTINRSCSMGSLDKIMNETKSIHDSTVGDNDETIVYQLDKSTIFTDPLRNSPRDRSHGISSISTGIPKHFSENCLSDLCNFHMQNGEKLPNSSVDFVAYRVSSEEAFSPLPNKHSASSLASLCSLSSSDSMPITSTIRGMIRSISNDTIISLTASLSSYNIQSPRKDRFEGIMRVTKK
uniref:Uncharacterized protein n=1 Tax=viral metagenome TaxID=1070528 RepID=A0A6C0IBP3_9ZZZZ